WDRYRMAKTTTRTGQSGAVREELMMSVDSHLLVFVTGVRRVGGIDIYTPKEVEAVNGTDVKLKCTFTSTQPVSIQSVTVSWNFRPMNSGSDESVFYYQDVPYPPMLGRFKGHAVWSGDIMKRDVSITLLNVPPTFNGTYICQVRNRPDVHGSNGEIFLRVVNKVSLSEISILAAAIGGSCAVILILLSIFVAVKFYRRKHMEPDTELQPPEHVWKDQTVL
uniref:Myelin protein zero-like 2b n=1 Tax=Sander lucioperca TaxID=283035 RepID=A0A8D0ANE4_SANLU